MKRTIGKRGLAFMLTVVMVLSMLMTVPQFSIESDAASKKYVKSLSVKKKVTVEKGETVKVKPTVKVAKKASKQVTVKCKNNKIAQVSYSKKKNTISIKGVKVGKTTITVTTKAKNKKGKKISKKITVTVKKKSKKESTTEKATTEQTTTEQATTEQQTTTEQPTKPVEPKPETPTTDDEGKVLNIYSWNEEFMTRVVDHYPGYEEVDATTGKIGDVVVKWNITSSMYNAYHINLDEALANQASADADDKVDLFLLEADNAKKYVDSDNTIGISDLGITEEDLKNQYQYTKDIMTSLGGELKGVTWQVVPCAMFYNRDAALEVLGTEDPAEVQEYVKNWDTFNDTATTMKENGYSMISTVNDTYRVYSNNVTSKWMENGEVNIDDNIMKWVDDSKALVDSGSAGTHDLWSDEWMEGFFPEGKVFAYFGPAWLVNYSMYADVEGSIGYNGRWGATEGPQSAFWGGTWMCAATGTDNRELIKDIMLKMTCDPDVMQDIVEQDDDFVNNKVVMDELAQSDYSSDILGGQNPLGVFSNNAVSLDCSNMTIYDQRYNEKFQVAMQSYFDGTLSKEDAVEYFKELLTQEDSDMPDDIPEDEDNPDLEWSDDVEDRVYVEPVALVGQETYAFFSPNESYSTTYMDGLEWSSSDTDVAEISEDGCIEYVGEGSVTIQATYNGETWESSVVVGTADASEYPLSLSCSEESVDLVLDGDITWEDPLLIDYNITGDVLDLSSLECVVYTELSTPIRICNWPEIEDNGFSVEVYPYSDFGEGGTGTLTTILWDPETETIYGVKVIPIIVE